MKVFVGLLLAVLLGLGGFVAAYLLEQKRLDELGSQLRTANAQLDEARSLLRLHVLYDRILELVDAAAQQKDYARAQALSTEFFDSVRAEVKGSGSSEFRAALESVLQARDAITASLARRDPAVVDMLGKIRRELRPFLAKASNPTGSGPGGQPPESSPGPPAPSTNAPAPATTSSAGSTR